MLAATPTQRKTSLPMTAVGERRTFRLGLPLRLVSKILQAILDNFKFVTVDWWMVMSSKQDLGRCWLVGWLLKAQKRSVSCRCSPLLHAPSADLVSIPGKGVHGFMHAMFKRIVCIHKKKGVCLCRYHCLLARPFSASR